jgi:hypothetical protein
VPDDLSFLDEAVKARIRGCGGRLTLDEARALRGLDPVDRKDELAPLVDDLVEQTQALIAQAEGTPWTVRRAPGALVQEVEVQRRRWPMVHAVANASLAAFLGLAAPFLLGAPFHPWVLAAWILFWIGATATSRRRWALHNVRATRRPRNYGERTYMTEPIVVDKSEARAQLGEFPRPGDDRFWNGGKR